MRAVNCHVYVAPRGSGRSGRHSVAIGSQGLSATVLNIESTIDTRYSPAAPVDVHSKIGSSSSTTTPAGRTIATAGAAGADPISTPAGGFNDARTAARGSAPVSSARSTIVFSSSGRAGEAGMAAAVLSTAARCALVDHTAAVAIRIAAAAP